MKVQNCRLGIVALVGLFLSGSGLVGCKDDTRSVRDARIPRIQTTPGLRGFVSCEELTAHLRTSLSEEMRVRMLQNNYRGGMVDDMTAESAPNADSAGSSDGGRQEGVDFSGTNNQETGVDEADFVKTDGYNIYVINGNRLEIFGVPEFGELEPLSKTEVEGRPNQLLLAGNKAIVFSNIYTYRLPEDHPLREHVQDYSEDWGYWYGSSSITKATVFDLTDKSNPLQIREMYLEGNYKTGRRVGSSVRMVSYAWIDVPGIRYWPEYPEEFWELDWDDPRREEIANEAVNAAMVQNDAVIATVELHQLVPQLYERLDSDTFIEHEFTESACSEFAVADDGLGRGFTSILTLDLLGDSFSFDADHIVTNYSEVYASLDTLILAEPSFDWWWFWNNEEIEDSTNIHRFDISNPGITVYTGSGRVSGLIRNQFSLSEYEGFVRVATTQDMRRWWVEEQVEPTNNVFVLAGEDELITIGHVGGIAEGESIWSSRFVGDSAYLVTFRNIDPLWTIDLSDPTNPQIRGELEIPGVSTYIHPLDDHLLTIGYGGNEDGLDWKTQVSLFDVSDFDNPTLASALSMAPTTGDDWNYAWSEAAWEHKAFQYWGPKNLLAIPLSTYRYSYNNGEYRYEYVSKLQIINVNTDDGLSLYDAVDHSDFFNSDSNRYWDYRDVRRSIFMGDYIYAISDRGITSHNLENMQLSASERMEGSYYEDYWCW